MKCPYCGSEHNWVFDTKDTKSYRVIRIRKCFDCLRKFTTLEEVYDVENHGGTYHARNLKLHEYTKYAVVKESASKLYPGARVEILDYIKSTDEYRVKNVESNYTCEIKSKDLEIEEKL